MPSRKLMALPLSSSLSRARARFLSSMCRITKSRADDCIALDLTGPPQLSYPAPPHRCRGPAAHCGSTHLLTRSLTHSLSHTHTFSLSHTHTHTLPPPFSQVPRPRCLLRECRRTQTARWIGPPHNLRRLWSRRHIQHPFARTRCRHQFTRHTRLIARKKMKCSSNPSQRQEAASKM